MITIRKMERGDVEVVRGMMRKFYTSPAVATNGSEEIFAANVQIGNASFNVDNAEDITEREGDNRRARRAGDT